MSTTTPNANAANVHNDAECGDAPNGVVIEAGNDDGASGATGKRKRDGDELVGTEAALADAGDKYTNEKAIYVFNKHKRTAEALGAKYRENTMNKYRYWYIPGDVSALNRDILILRFGKKPVDTPMPPPAKRPHVSNQASSSSSSSSSSPPSMTPIQPSIEPSQVSPALSAILKCNKQLLQEFTSLSAKLTKAISQSP